MSGAARALTILLCIAGGCTTGETAVAPRLETLEDLRIGSVDDPETTLTMVTAILVGADGALYVTQPQDRQIRVFDDAGRPVRIIGRPGSGPGEFGSVGAPGWLGDTLYVPDFQSRRVTFFAPDGTPRGDLPLQNMPSSGNPMLIPSVPSALFADGTGIMSYLVPSNAIDEEGITESPVVRVDRRGAVLDTLHMRTLGPDQLSLSFGQGRGAGAMYTSQPWLRTPFLSYTRDGSHIYLVDRDPASGGTPAYGVARIDLAGDTLWSRRYPYTAVPIDAARRDSALDAFVTRFESFRERQGMALLELRGKLEDALKLPAHVPPVRTARVADDGTLWLQMADAIWQLISPGGEPVATVAVPDEFSILAVRGDTIYGTIRDELDVPYVVRRIVQR